MLSNKWKPIYVQNSSLIRVGKKFDGGYVILKKFIKETSLLISFGLSDDWSFEKYFFKTSNCYIESYDHTVTSNFWLKRFISDIWSLLILKKLRPSKIIDIFKFIDYIIFFSKKKIIHIKKKIGKDSKNSISLISVVKKNIKFNKIFLKVDIESSEYLIIDEIINFPDKIIGFVIEFHELNLYKKKVENFLVKAKKNYSLIHIHGNNYTGLDEDLSPRTVEMTFARNDYVNKKNKINNKKYPIRGLDQPCNKNHPDIKIYFK